MNAATRWKTGPDRRDIFAKNPFRKESLGPYKALEPCGSGVLGPYGALHVADFATKTVFSAYQPLFATKTFRRPPPPGWARGPGGLPVRKHWARISPRSCIQTVPRAAALPARRALAARARALSRARALPAFRALAGVPALGRLFLLLPLAPLSCDGGDGPPMHRRGWRRQAACVRAARHAACAIDLAPRIVNFAAHLLFDRGCEDGPDLDSIAQA